MKKYLFLLLGAGILFFCQGEDVPASFADETTISVLPPETTETNTSNELALAALTGQTRISVEEAQQTALFTAIQMREIEGIATKSELQVASVEVVKNGDRKPYVATKSGEQEQADVYIINFANQQGYVVTSADRRVPGVLAYNSYGHLGDTLTNPGQAILFSYMQDYIEQERENFEKNKEALKIQAEEMIFKQLPKEKQEELIAQGYFDKEGKRIITKGGHQKVMFCINDDGGDINPKNDGGYEEEYTTYGEWQTKYVKAPLLKTLWGQSEDYNNKVTMQCGKDEAPVGCVAIAVGQLMAYHKKPAVFKGRTMHWDEITQYPKISNVTTVAKEDIQHLLARLGDSDLLTMKYGCNSSSSNMGSALYTLKQMGYNGVYATDYENNMVISEIKNNKPVYMKGDYYVHKYKTGWWIFGTTHTVTKGHAWVLDGYVLKTREVKHYTKCPNMPGFTHIGENRLELIHNNLGWDGEDNGWYHTGIFDTNGSREATGTYKSNTPKNFQFNKKMIINIQ